MKKVVLSILCIISSTVLVHSQAFIASTQTVTRRNTSDTFVIYSSSLGGSTPKLLISDPIREMNHAYISPDGTKLLFTRYNYFSGGVAMEDPQNRYFQTEVVICDVNAENCTSVIPPIVGVVAGGAVWAVPDSNNILFVTNNISGGNRNSGIAEYNLNTHQINFNYFNKTNNSIGDPKLIGSLLAVADSVNSGVSAIYDLSGSTFTQLSNPVAAGSYGDTDPDISPDGTLVAFNRYMNGTNYAIVTVPVASPFSETNISGTLTGQALNGFPHFSSDGQLILYWALDAAGNNGLWTMKTDGTNKTQVPIPGYPTGSLLLNNAAFYPNQGSSSSAAIVYSARIQ